MERFPKIIDIVGRDDPELTEGRHRYVAYKRQGIEPTVVKRGWSTIDLQRILVQKELPPRKHHSKTFLVSAFEFHLHTT